MSWGLNDDGASPVKNRYGDRERISRQREEPEERLRDLPKNREQAKGEYQMKSKGEK